MTARRFTDKPDLDPTAVRELPAGHPALTENGTGRYRAGADMIAYAARQHRRAAA